MFGRNYVIGHKYQSFFRVLDSMFLMEKNRWKRITVEGLNGLIYNNLRLIIEQTHNVKNAQDLQQKLLRLSAKINENFTSPSAHILAFEIMGIAQGIFSKEEDKVDYTIHLPLEIKKIIYKNTPSELLTKCLITKIESKIAKETQIEWINDENVSLKAAGFKTIQDAIHYVKINNDLYSVNLSEYPKKLEDRIWFEDLWSHFSKFIEIEMVTNKDLEKLKDCNWIKRLFISSNMITDDGLKFLKGMPLQTIDFSGCYQLTDNVFESLKGMQLRNMRFKGCNKLTDKSFEYIKDFPVQKIDFSECTKLTDKSLEHLQGLQLKEVWFGECNLLTDKGIGHLKGMPLECVHFSNCNQLTDKALESLMKMPLKSVNFGGCNQLTNKALEYLKEMPLQNISFYGCNLLTDWALEPLMGMSLQSAVFAGCDNITDEAFDKLWENYTNRGLELAIIDDLN